MTFKTESVSKPSPAAYRDMIVVYRDMIVVYPANALNGIHNHSGTGAFTVA